MTAPYIKYFILLAVPVLCSILFGTTALHAQSPCEISSFPKEEVSLHLDRNICLAGETIWFKAWCFVDGRLDQELSKVLYVEIFDETEKAIVQQKYLLENNKAAGTIQIPEDTPSKYYFLKAYTRYMRNFSSADFHYQQIIIANPLIENGSIEVSAAEANENKNRTISPQYERQTAEHTLQISLQRDKYRPRQQVDFQIKGGTPLSADVSVSVRLKGLGNQPAQQVMTKNHWLQAACQRDPFCQMPQMSNTPPLATQKSEQQWPLMTDSISLQWLPETRGLTISGLLQDEKDEAVAGVLTSVSILQATPMLYMGITDNEGAFTICLQDMQSQKGIFVGTEEDKYQVLIRNDFDTALPDVTAVPLLFDSTLHQTLEPLDLNRQLEQVYPRNQMQTVYSPTQPNIAPTNIVAPDRRIELSDFIEVSTMSEVFNEISNGISLRREKGRAGIAIFNFEEEKWYNAPLVLLDNVPIFSIEELLKVDPAKIEAFEIYHSDYILGDFTIGGIFSIISNTDDFAGYKWGEQVAFTNFKGYTVSQPFEQALHEEQSHYPDFRPVLYWQPHLQLQPSQTSESISFFAPDRPGIYEIEVQGFTASGESCFGYVTFEVDQGL